MLGSAVAYGQFQTTGTGGTGAPGGISQNIQYNTNGIFGGILNGVSGECLTWATPPVWGSCAAGSQTSIAAGTNITTSGTAGNVTVNVLATPTFTSITTTLASVTGWLTGPGANFQTITVVGNLSAATAQFTGFLTASGANLQTATLAGALNGATANFTGNLTGTTAQFSGQVTGTSAVFQTITDAGITGTQCVQSIAGVLSGTGVGCATQTSTPSIAAGTNITTSGTSANITVNAVPTTPGGALQFNSAGAFGSLTGTSGQLLIAQGGASTPSYNTLSQDCTISATGVITCTKTNNVAFGTLATASTPLTLSLGGTSAALVPANGAVITANSTVMAVTTLTTGFLIISSTGTLASVAVPLDTAHGGSGAVPVTITVAGSNTQVQYNANGNLGANASLTAGTTGTLAAGLYTNTPAGSGNLSFISPSITQLGLAGVMGSGGWINWGGESRLAADTGFKSASTTTSTTGLSVTLQGGRTYSVDADLIISNVVSGISGGIQLALTGTYGSTDTHYFGYAVDGQTITSSQGVAFDPIRGATQATAKNTVVANTVLSGTTAYAKIMGTISVSSSGTLVVTAAQSVTNTTGPTTLTRGSRLIVHDMP